MNNTIGFLSSNIKDKKTLILVDKDIYSKIQHHKWHTDRDGYVCYNQRKGKKSKNIKLHRLVMDIIDNKDKNIVVDHINHNKADNRRINLRICTRHQNNLNSSNNPRGISKYKGVSLDKKSKIHPWRAYITHNKKFKLIGTFATEKEAALAYNRAIIKYYGEFANPNKIN